MDSENLLLTLAIAALVVSAVGAGFTYYSIYSTDSHGFAGFVTSTGTANLTVLSQAAINFTINSINWGPGKLDTGAPNATLVTTGVNNTGGNWTNITQGFIITNIGNVNVSVYLLAGKNAMGFVGGTNPLYQYNVTNNQTGSCVSASGFNLGQWYDVNTTTLGTSGTYVCSNFSYFQADSTIRVDLKLVIPSDSLTGALSDTMTATALQSA
jgi:hypothetical protein